MAGQGEPPAWAVLRPGALRRATGLGGVVAGRAPASRAVGPSSGCQSRVPRMGPGGAAGLREPPAGGGTEPPAWAALRPGELRRAAWLGRIRLKETYTLSGSFLVCLLVDRVFLGINISIMLTLTKIFTVVKKGMHDSEKTINTGTAFAQVSLLLGEKNTT